MSDIFKNSRVSNWAVTGLLVIGIFCLLVATPTGVGHAQSSAQEPQTLPSEKLSIDTAMGNFAFDVEVADEPQEREIGLMNRRQMDVKHGMLFEFPKDEVVTMWMKDTYIPLDMVFIRADGTVARIEARTTPESEDIISSGGPVANVLELNAGVAKMIGLKPGDHVNHRLFQKQ